MKPLLVAGLLVLAVASIYFSWRFMHEPEGTQQRTWFFDLNTNELFALPGDSRPPMPAPSGDLHGAPSGTPAGVLATVMKDDEGNRRVVALMTCDDVNTPGIMFVRRITDKEWYPETSASGQQIEREVAAELAKGTQSFPE